MVELFHRPSVLSSALGNIANQNSEYKTEKNKKIATVVRDYNSLPLLLLQLIVTFIFTIISIILRMADLPDLSHLTAEERRIIESVMMRQKQEEEREHEIMR